jgi:hypothetical protein
MPSKSRDVYVHVGAPKSGTTFIQDTLWTHRDGLAADGVLYPYTTPTEHFAAMLDLRERGWGGIRRRAVAGAWDRVAARVRAWEGSRAVLTNELLGGASQQQIGRLVDSLAPARVHVVLTARDLARQLVSSWQEQIKHNLSVPLDEFLAEMLEHGPDTKPPYARQFWPLQDPAHVLCRWSRIVGREHVLLVTVPPLGARGATLWHRFCEATGLDARTYRPAADSSNVSLSAVEAEFYRRVNAGIADLSARDYTVLVRQNLMRQIVPTRGERPTLPAAYFDAVRQRSLAQVEALEQYGFPVSGDLRDLLPDPFHYTSQDTATIGTVTDETLLPLALQSINVLLRSAAERRAELKTLTRELIAARNEPLNQHAARQLRRMLQEARARASKQSR